MTIFVSPVFRITVGESSSQAPVVELIKSLVISLWRYTVHSRTKVCLNFRVPLWASSSEAEWEKEREEKTIRHLISTSYGAGYFRRFSSFSDAKKKVAKTKTHVLFLERCVFYCVIPTFLQNRCPIKTKRARTITQRYQRSLLKECLHNERRTLHRLQRKIKRDSDVFKEKFSSEHFDLITKITESTYDKLFQKEKKSHRWRIQTICTHSIHPRRYLL